MKCYAKVHKSTCEYTLYIYIHVYVHVGAQGKNAKYKVRKREVAKSSSTEVRQNHSVMLAGRVKGRGM